MHGPGSVPGRRGTSVMSLPLSRASAYPCEGAVVAVFQVRTLRSGTGEPSARPRLSRDVLSLWWIRSWSWHGAAQCGGAEPTARVRQACVAGSLALQGLSQLPGGSSRGRPLIRLISCQWSVFVSAADPGKQISWRGQERWRALSSRGQRRFQGQI